MWETGALCGVVGNAENWSRWVGRSPWIGEDGNRWGKDWLPAWPRRSGASEGEWDLPFQPVIDFGRAESRPRTTTGTSEMGA